MASHKSAAKRARQDRVRRARNRQVKSAVKTGVKKVRGALAGGDADAASAALREAERLVRKAASRGVIPRERASRQISRLARQVHRAQSPD